MNSRLRLDLCREPVTLFSNAGDDEDKPLSRSLLSDKFFE